MYMHLLTTFKSKIKFRGKILQTVQNRPLLNYNLLRLNTWCCIPTNSLHAQQRFSANRLTYTHNILQKYCNLRGRAFNYAQISECGFFSSMIAELMCKRSENKFSIVHFSIYHTTTNQLIINLSTNLKIPTEIITIRTQVGDIFHFCLYLKSKSLQSMKSSSRVKQ